MGTSHSKRKCRRRHQPREDETTCHAKKHISSISSSDATKQPMTKDTKDEEERNCLPDAIVLESWTTASSSSSSMTFSSNHSLSSSSSVEYCPHPLQLRRQRHPAESVGCGRTCSCSLPAPPAGVAVDSTHKSRHRTPLSCIDAKGIASSLDVSHASDDVSMENDRKILRTRKSRMMLRDDEVELKEGGCGSRWRALAWIIDMCMDGRKSGNDKHRKGSGNNCKCSSSGVGSKSSTMPGVGRRNIDDRRRQCVDDKRAKDGRCDRFGFSCVSAGAVDSSDAEVSLEAMMRNLEHRNLLRQQQQLQQLQQQTILDYDDKMLGDIIRINMIQNNVYIPNHSHHHDRLSDAFGRHSHCGRGSRRPMKGGGGKGGGRERGSAGGDGGGSGGDGVEEARWRHMEETTLKKVTTDDDDEHRENETNIFILPSTAADDRNERIGGKCVDSSDCYARHFRRSCCTSPGPNKDVRGGPSSIRLTIVHGSNDTHSFDRRTTTPDVLPRRRKDPDVANYFGSSIQDGRRRQQPEVAVMSSCHYWHRHRHREKNERRAMDRVIEWIMKDEVINESQDVAPRKTKPISHPHHTHHLSDGNHHHFRYHSRRKYNHHHQQHDHSWRHIIV